MEQIFKFIIGLFIVWLFITMIPVLIWLLIGYGIYKLGEWAYNEWDKHPRGPINRKW